MALNSQYSNAARNAAADAIAALLNGGTLELYDGAQPANAETAVSAQTKLAVLTFGNPAFAAAAAGVATANPITPDAAADATSNATWFRAKRSAANGSGVVFDGTVGVAGTNLVMGSVAIQVNAIVNATGLTLTIAAAGT